MKYIRTVFAILLILTLMLNVKDVFAMDTGFSTEPLSEADKNNFLSNANISILDTEPKKEAIECFDVNEEGMIAIGHKASDYKILCIYTHDGAFQYGYKFNCSGSFGVEWDGNNINIYFARSDVIVAVNTIGEIMDVRKVQNTIDNNSYRNHFIFSNERIVDDTEYTIRNDMGVFNLFASSYSQLVASKSTGETNVLYDANLTQYMNTLALFIVVLIFVTFVVFGIIWQFIKLKRNV